jgi:hypothetical protein
MILIKRELNKNKNIKLKHSNIWNKVKLNKQGSISHVVYL